MARVMIRCPETGGQVFTGIETPPSNIGMLPPINTSLVCSLCGRTHVWSMLEADLTCEPVDITEPPTPEMRFLLECCAANEAGEI